MIHWKLLCPDSILWSIMSPSAAHILRFIPCSLKCTLPPNLIWSGVGGLDKSYCCPGTDHDPAGSLSGLPSSGLQVKLSTHLKVWTGASCIAGESWWLHGSLRDIPSGVCSSSDIPWINSGLNFEVNWFKLGYWTQKYIWTESSFKHIWMILLH